MSGGCPQRWTPANATGSMPVSGTAAAKGSGSGRGSAGPQARRHPESSAAPLAQSGPAGPQRNLTVEVKTKEAHCLIYSSDSLLTDANRCSLMGGCCSEHIWSVNTSSSNTFSSLNLYLRGFQVAFLMWPEGPSVPAKAPWLEGTEVSMF